VNWRKIRVWLGGRFALFVAPILVISLVANGVLGIFVKGVLPSLFDWTLLLLGATAGFIIVNFIIRAHEQDRWRRFRQNMVWDLYIVVCELIEAYDINSEYLAPRQRRFAAHVDTDYYQSADTPVTLRRFRADLDRRRADVANTLGLSLVGITPETAQGIAGFKAVYNQLYTITRYIIDVDDATGPVSPDDFQHVSARSAYVSLFRQKLDRNGAPNGKGGYQRGGGSGRFALPPRQIGPFTRLLSELFELAQLVELDFEAVDSLSVGKVFIAPDVEPDDTWVQEHLRLHSSRVVIAESLDERLQECADHAMRYVSGASKKMP